MAEGALNDVLVVQFRGRSVLIEEQPVVFQDTERQTLVPRTTRQAGGGSTWDISPGTGSLANVGWTSRGMSHQDYCRRCVHFLLLL